MNQWRGQGVLTRLKCGRGQNGPWAFFSIKCDGEKARFDGKAFEEAAEALSVAQEGDEVSIQGRLGPDKDKEGNWRTVIVAEQVTAERVNAAPKAPKEEEDLPF